MSKIIRPNVVSISRFGDVSMELELQKHEEVKDVWLTYIDDSQLRLHLGIHFTVEDFTCLRFKAVPADFKNIMDMPVSGVMVEFIDPLSYRTRYIQYDSPWLRHNQPIPKPVAAILAHPL